MAVNKTGSGGSSLPLQKENGTSAQGAETLSPNAPKALDWTQKPARPNRVVERVTTTVSLDREARIPPREVLERGEAFLNSYVSSSQIAIDGIQDDGFVDLGDDMPWEPTRLRSNDLAKALLRLNASVWAVLRDLRAGTLSPAEFGKPDWAQVDGQALSALAARRLQSGVEDYEADAKAMIEDRLSTHAPLRFRDEKTGQRVALTPDNAGDIWKESVASAVAPNLAAQSIAEFAFAKTMRAQAVAVANVPESKRDTALAEAKLATAHALFVGKDLAPNATVALTTCARVAGVSLADVTQAPAGATQTSLEEQQLRGEIVGFAATQAGFAVAKARSVREVATEVLARMNQTPLVNLSPKARAQLVEMLGPRKSPGSTLRQRLASEDSGRAFRREIGTDVNAALYGAFASIGLPVVAANAAWAAGAGQVARYVSATVAGSVQYSAVSRAGQDAGVADYLKDMGMVGVLGAFNRVSTLVKLGKLAGPGVAVATTAGVMTGVEAVEKGQLPTWQDYGHHLAVVGVLHGVNVALTRLEPALSPDAPAREAFEKLKSKVVNTNTEVETTLNALAEVLAQKKAIQGEEVPTTLAREQTRLEARLDHQRGEADSLRTELLAFTQRHLSSHAQAVLDDFGKSMPAESKGPVGSQQRMLQEAIVGTFVDARRGFGIREGEGVLQSGVKGVSQKVVSSLLDVVRHPLASTSEANIKHLGSVFQDALRTTAKRNGGPLSQAQVDRLALETVLTDIWYKDVAAPLLTKAETSPTNAGSTGGEIHEHLKATAKARVLEGATVDPVVKQLVSEWIDRGFVPMNRADVVKDLETRAREVAAKEGMNAAETEASVHKVVEEGSKLWGERIMGTGEWANVQAFMLGTWIHGIPSFSMVANAVRSAPATGATAQQVYEAVLGHHMAGFIAAGFGRGRLSVDFKRLEAEGQLPKGGAKRLGDLYTSSSALAEKWRPLIERGLTDEQREAYWQEARPQREAEARLTKAVLTQLHSDDLGQFTTYDAMGKWFEIKGRGAADMNAAINGVADAAQAYAEQARARDPNSNPVLRGQAFYDASLLALSRLGLSLDATSGRFRPSRRGEPAHRELAQRIAQDPPLMAQLRAFDAQLAKAFASGGRTGDVEDRVVEWFRSLPADLAAGTRLSSG